ncbi:MAG: alpha/beta fold hydrolase [Solirubrobacteraceae bacterium]
MFELQETVLHGHRIGYRIAGSGPAVLLIHGMLNNSRHWRAVAERLARTHTVIAPDLHGHGGSAGPLGDYSLGAHAAGIRDLVSGLGIERATVIGHSLGGGVAMQFFYQFPERCERVVLVSSGGLGRDVSWPLRLAAAPGVEGLLAGAASRPVLGALARVDNPYATAAHRALSSLNTPAARRGFLWTLRSVIDLKGQKVCANDRLYLLGDMPTLIVWGGRDHTIPVAHGREAYAAVGGRAESRFELLPDARHFPHLEDPGGLADAIARFLAEVPPAALDADDWEHLMRRDGRLRSVLAA